MIVELHIKPAGGLSVVYLSTVCHSECSVLGVISHAIL